jgi:hypothetical protein
MSEDTAPDSATKILEALLAFSEDPEGVASMSREEVRAELAEEGIALDAHQKRLREMMQQTRGQERLTRAAEQRARLEAQAASRPVSQSGSGASLVAEIRHRLGILGQRQPQAVGLYNRKLESATDDDLRAILEDLALLDSTDEAASDEERP